MGLSSRFPKELLYYNILDFYMHFIETAIVYRHFGTVISEKIVILYRQISYSREQVFTIFLLNMGCLKTSAFVQ